MKLQILDCDYVMVNTKPVIRIFCKDQEGKPICVFYDKFLPYFYLHTAEEIDDVVYEIEKMGLRTEIVEKFLPMGFHKYPRKLIKIIGNDPSKVPEIRDDLKKYGTPYEADIMFKYRFMSDFGLRGMGWIEVEGNKVRTETVKSEAIEATSIKPIEVLENAPLKYLALDIECITNEDRIPEPEKDPIIIISLAFYPDFEGKKEIIIVSKRTNGEKIIGCDNETEMLKKFLEIVNQYDPDIVTGYNINNFDLPYILKRLEILNLPRNIGRSEKNAWCHKAGMANFPSISGRTVVDPYEILKADPWVKFRRYDLNTVAEKMLGEKKIEIGGIKEMRELWNSNNGDKLNKFLKYAEVDAVLVKKLVVDKQMMDKFFEIAKLSGLLLQDALGGQAIRHERYLMEEFNKRNFVFPCKPDKEEVLKRKKERERAGLKGALVLEPVVGLHDKGTVVVLDFTSLYPSLMYIYNICPTTLMLKNEDVKHNVSPVNTRIVDKSVRKGILSEMVHHLVKTRQEVKKIHTKETDEEKRRVLTAKQLALKDMANSMYGYTGYLRARLYIMDVANTITGYGRHSIVKTEKITEENFPVKVIYSDTDSVFVKTDISDLDMAKALGDQISELACQQLDGLDLKFEKTFKRFLIMAKKRYAGWAFELKHGKWADKILMKGIETVRRDWCPLTTKTMDKVLKIILLEGDINKAARHVRDVIHELSKGTVPLEDLTIVKGVTKSAESYDAIQPHVEVAKKMMKRDPTMGNIVGTRVGYVIIKGNQMLSKRAEDPKYVKEKGLQIDPQYYIDNQLMPPIERIFETCGVSKSELLEGSRQKNLSDIFASTKIDSPEKMILEDFDSVVCKKCHWEFRRPTLNGNCPKCNSQLYFSFNGNMAKTIKVKSD